ncbi:MAG: hypothetical protein KME42_13755 [Tildeniella nuda ZEHNDER 1965/U140]|jgi:hypothetical protein|nr:hypothetical protein [Tildeniella nuda ZEHNDER 1965/U140]
MTDYNTFLNAKLSTASQTGFEVNPEWLGTPEPKYAFQPHIVKWSLRCGRAGIYASYGKGKTYMQLKWADCVAKYTGDRVLILAPLAVAEQTVQEGEKFGIRVEYAESGDEALKSTSPIIITNYDRLDKFESAIASGEFSSAALDECFPHNTLIDVIEDGKLTQKEISNDISLPFLTNAIESELGGTWKHQKSWFPQCDGGFN